MYHRISQVLLAILCCCDIGLIWSTPFPPIAPMAIGVTDLNFEHPYSPEWLFSPQRVESKWILFESELDASISNKIYNTYELLQELSLIATEKNGMRMTELISSWKRFSVLQSWLFDLEEIRKLWRVMKQFATSSPLRTVARIFKGNHWRLEQFRNMFLDCNEHTSAPISPIQIRPHILDRVCAKAAELITNTPAKREKGSKADSLDHLINYVDVELKKWYESRIIEDLKDSFGRVEDYVEGLDLESTNPEVLINRMVTGVRQEFLEQIVNQIMKQLMVVYFNDVRMDQLLATIALSEFWNIHCDEELVLNLRSPNLYSESLLVNELKFKLFLSQSIVTGKVDAAFTEFHKNFEKHLPANLKGFYNSLVRKELLPFLEKRLYNETIVGIEARKMLSLFYHEVPSQLEGKLIIDLLRSHFEYNYSYQQRDLGDFRRSFQGDDLTRADMTELRQYYFATADYLQAHWNSFRKIGQQDVINIFEDADVNDWMRQAMEMEGFSDAVARDAEMVIKDIFS